MRRSASAALLVAGLFALSACANESEPPAAAPAIAPTVTASSIEPTPSPPPTAVNPAPPTCRGDSSALADGRTDIQPSGNRRAPGGIDLLSANMSLVQLPGVPEWVVPILDADEPCSSSWYVTLSDGQAVVVDTDGRVTSVGTAITPPQSSGVDVRSANSGLDQFDEALSDSRIVTFGQWTAALVEPTDRYGHGVLGDRIEAAAVEVINTDSGERVRITIDEPSVIEGISPILLDVDQPGDDVPEVLVTLSNATDGAWLALYNIDGTVRARSDAIGQGNRWRNQLGAGPTGPNGEYEIVDVRTPHLAGIVEYFRVVGDRLELVASTSGYTSHVIGSRNLDMGILVDADADKLLEVVLPTRDRSSLAVLDRVGDDVVEIARIDLSGQLNTNIATQWIVGQAWLAVGTSNSQLLVFGDPDMVG